MWVRSFEEEFVVSRLVVHRKLEQIMLDYDNQVRRTTRSNRNVSLRVRNKMWMDMDVKQPKRGPRRKEAKNSSLFDIGKNMDQLTGDEAIFYQDQCGARRYLLSQEVDEVREEEKAAARAEETRQEEQLQDEMEYINEDLEHTPVSSKRRRQIDSPITIEQECQANINVTPLIRKVRNTTHEIRDTIATVSYKAAISVEKARTATQVVCDKLYGHKFDLQASSASTWD